MPVLAPGSRVLVREEEWLVRSSLPVATGGYAVRVIGMSELVRNQERSFLTALDEISEMRHADEKVTRLDLNHDDTPNVLSYSITSKGSLSLLISSSINSSI